MRVLHLEPFSLLFLKVLVVGHLLDKLGHALAERLGEHRGSGVEVTLVLSQDDLAAWVGATREATSRALSRLRADGLLTTGRQRIVLTDLPALRRRASQSA